MGVRQSARAARAMEAALEVGAVREVRAASAIEAPPPMHREEKPDFYLKRLCDIYIS